MPPTPKKHALLCRFVSTEKIVFRDVQAARVTSKTPVFADRPPRRAASLSRDTERPERSFRMLSMPLASATARRVLVAVSSAVALMIATGCAAEVAQEDPMVAERQDELSSAAQALVGKYYNAQTVPGGFARLSLTADGRFTAKVDVSHRALCDALPCVAPETGTWAARRVGRALRLDIRPEGGSARAYTATRTPETLVLTLAGQTETLRALATDGCLDDADCGTEEVCGPKVCMLWCPVGDPTCCGPSTCQPKPRDLNPTPTCVGAWRDETGRCRAPNDGVYPDSCCASEPKPCGD
jgi:hypothetical protein